MTTPRILVAGVGNIFLGDDAFGVEVAQRLARRSLPEAVRVVDFGIRGIDLTYALLDGYEIVILLDATQRGGPPGTLYVLEPQLDGPPQPDCSTPLIEMHAMDPAKVLRLAAAMGSTVRRIILVGCEPKLLGTDEDMQMELSAPVRAALDEAVALTESLLREILEEESFKSRSLTVAALE